MISRLGALSAEKVATRSRVATTLLLVGGIVSLNLIASAPSYAGHDGKANSGDPDNGSHYVDRHDLSYYGNLAAEHGVAQLDRAADFHATFDGTGDVDIYDGAYGDTGWSGITDCTDASWFGQCDIFRVRFNQDAMSGEGSTSWRHLGCHELGHTGGLGHRYASTDAQDNSCMRQGLWNATSLDSHDLEAITAVV